MTELKISISKKLAKEIKKHPEIKWDNVASAAFEKLIQNLEDRKRKEEVKEMMKISEYSLKEFLESEPDLYTDNDLKKRYR
jgi:hypothetical protein